MTVSSATSKTDVIVVGAGFAGIYMLYKLRELGLTTRVFEAGEDVGGTWYWNRYPGARCDFQSIEYCYSFSKEVLQEWTWTERYASQPEIFRYLQFVADKFNLRPDITFRTRVTSAAYDEDKNQWCIGTDTGESASARFLISAAGCLSLPVPPKLPGVEEFAGESYHTGRWPQEPVDFAGQRVGIIGTGSSGVQLIPTLAQRAAELFVFQRTPNHCVPANNYPLPESYYRRVKQRYHELWRKWLSSSTGTSFSQASDSALDVTDEERELVYQFKWSKGGLDFMSSFDDLLVDQAANDTAADFVRRKIREIVKDENVANQLVPAGHPLGSKRLSLVNGYFEAFNRPNVHLISAQVEPIEEIQKNGVKTSKNVYELETLIYATGYDAFTGPLLAMDISGRGGRLLREEWGKARVKAYLGLAMAGFPNLFVITGPGSPFISNVVRSIEQHVDWIAGCLAHMLKHHIAVIEATESAQTAWMSLVDIVAQSTVFTKVNSFYSGDNIRGKPHQFLPYLAPYAMYKGQLDNVVSNNYEGFVLSPEKVSK